MFVELLYGGYWEVEHQLSRKESVGGDNEHQHMFALTFLLQPSWDEFDHVTKCLENLRSKWPSTNQKEEMIQHFYFEVSSNTVAFTNSK